MNADEICKEIQEYSLGQCLLYNAKDDQGEWICGNCPINRMKEHEQAENANSAQSLMASINKDSIRMLVNFIQKRDTRFNSELNKIKCYLDCI